MNKHIDHNFEKRVSNINKQRGQDKQLKQYYDVRSGEYMWIEDYANGSRSRKKKKKFNLFHRVVIWIRYKVTKIVGGKSSSVSDKTKREFKQAIEEGFRRRDKY